MRGANKISKYTTTGIILLLLCITLCHTNANAGNDRFTTGSGLWQNMIWSDVSHTDPPNILVTCNSNKKHYIDTDTITSNCGILHVSSGGGLLVVRAGGCLIVNGDLELSGGADLQVDSGGKVMVYGDLLISGGGDGAVAGYMHIEGSITTTGGSTLNCVGTGTTSVCGTTEGTDICENGGCPLDINSLNFEATKTKHGVQLSWSFPSDLHEDQFILERSQDAMIWETMDQVQSMNSFNIDNRLEIVDTSPYEDLTYYRLRQTHTDGKISWSPVQSVLWKPEQQLKVLLDLSKAQVTITSVSLDDIEHLAIYNIIGNNVKNLTRIVENDNSTFNIDISRLPTGAYVIITPGGSSLIEKL